MSPHNWQWCLVASLVFVGVFIQRSAAATGELDYEYGESPDLYDENASDLDNSLGEEKASRLKVRMRSSMKMQRGEKMRVRAVRRHARVQNEILDPLQKKLHEYNSKLEKERALLQQHEKQLAAERAKFRQHQEQREKLIVAAMRNKHKGAVVPKSYGVNDILEKFKLHGGYKGHRLPQDLADTSDLDENGNNANDQKAEGEDEGDMANDRGPDEAEQNEDVGPATDANIGQGDEADENGGTTTPEPPIAPKAASGRRRGKARFKPAYDESADEAKDNSVNMQLRRRKKNKQQRRQRRKPKYVGKAKSKHVVHLPSVESAQVEPRRSRDNKVNEKRNQRKRQNTSDESADDSKMNSEYRDKILRNNVLRSIF